MSDPRQPVQYNGTLKQIPTVKIAGKRFVRMSDVTVYFPGATCLECDGYPLPFVLTKKKGNANPLRVIADTNKTFEAYIPGNNFVIRTWSHRIELFNLFQTIRLFVSF